MIPYPCRVAPGFVYGSEAPNNNPNLTVFLHLPLTPTSLEEVSTSMHLRIPTGVSNPRPDGCTRPRMNMNVAQHKIIKSLKTFFFFFFCSAVFVSVCVFNVWPKATLLLPVWPRDAKKLHTPAGGFSCAFLSNHRSSELPS